MKTSEVNKKSEGKNISMLENERMLLLNSIYIHLRFFLYHLWMSVYKGDIGRRGSY